MHRKYLRCCDCVFEFHRPSLTGVEAKQPEDASSELGGGSGRTPRACILQTRSCTGGGDMWCPGGFGDPELLSVFLLAAQ